MYERTAAGRERGEDVILNDAFNGKTTNHETTHKSL